MFADYTLLLQYTELLKNIILEEGGSEAVWGQTGDL